MAASDEDHRNEQPTIADDEAEDIADGEIDEDDGDDFEEEEELGSQESTTVSERAKMEKLFRRLATEGVVLRVHDVLIRGNTKTRHLLIDNQVEGVKNASTLQELLQAATVANAQLRRLEIFDSVSITLDSGPPELPATATVLVEVVEAKNPFAAEIGIFSKPEVESCSFEGSLKLKNLFGFGDCWDGSLHYCWDQIPEVSAGVYLPRFKGLATPMLARVYLLSKDWLNFSSYKERALGLSLGIISSGDHDLAYNLSWRNLTDPSQLASGSIRRQLGHGFLSSLKYRYKIDTRNSLLRPTQGYAFVSTSQIGGLVPDYWSLNFLCQEFDLRCAFPLGFYNAALNLGISCGAIFPRGSGFLNMASPLPERFFLGGCYSPVCTLSGPTTLLGFKSRGLGPSEPRRQNRENSNNGSPETHSSWDFIGGDLALTAFADLSFDLPLRTFREAGVHGHFFACAGSLTKITENAFRDFSFPKFHDSFRSSAGFGIILPTRLFRMEVNYCYVLKQLEHSSGKTGVQFSFSPTL
ncbi:hypothetical protein NMG60_11011982 [Bertholletia excelsa]